MSSIFSMEGKCVIVTGGAGNLLTPTISQMLMLGAKVAVADILEPRYDQMPDEFADNLFYKKCDAYNTSQIKGFVDFAIQKMGKINVLVNGATFGAGYGAHATPDIMT
ncbi:MAG: SDR family NAD(P)-dependent oxidoreductase, partial [Clostridia bacterium]|nr:SDR family NAD(P)-dependent oxidoreductase [Clostridia bacterium]